MEQKHYTKDEIQVCVNKFNIEAEHVFGMKGAKIGLAKNSNHLVILSYSQKDLEEIEGASTDKEKRLIEKIALSNIITKAGKNFVLNGMKYLTPCMITFELEDKYRHVDLYQ